MAYILTHTELIEMQTERVLSVIKMTVIKKGFVTVEDIAKHLSIPNDQLIEIRDNLLAAGIIEIYTP
jgi:Mn-dependent DtxR family transcriptional regulator